MKVDMRIRGQYRFWISRNEAYIVWSGFHRWWENYNEGELWIALRRYEDQKL